MSFLSALVTGATGFIGSALVNKLVEQGVQVTCLTTNTHAARMNPAARYLRVNQFNSAELLKVLQGFSTDVVFHLAAYGVRPEDRDPLKMLENNTYAITALLMAIKDWPIKAFIYSGSCAEYAPIKTRSPIQETHPILPESIYGAAKAAAGIYGASLAASLNLPFTLLRLFGVYGTGEASYRLVPHLIHTLNKGNVAPLSVGQQIRDFLHINDVIDALLIAVGLPKKINIYNICSSISVTVREVAQNVALLMQCSEELLNFGALPYRENEVMWLVGDNTAFSQATGWSPKISLQDGIRLMINDYERGNHE